MRSERESVLVVTISRWLCARLLVALLTLPAGASFAAAQTQSDVDLAAQVDSGDLPLSFDPDDQSHTAAGIDSISPYSGLLALTVPIGPLYQVGPGLSFQVQLHYSSRVWGPGTWVYFANPLPPPALRPEPYMVLQGDPALGLGWTFSLGKIIEASAGAPLAYVGPDGSAHRLYNRRVFCSGTCPVPDGFFYTRDGSYLRLKYISATGGYRMWSPSGNETAFGKHVGPPDTVSYDDPPTSYLNDYGRGRNAWYATSIANPYLDAITISYQSGFPWVPYQVSIPSVGGGSPRVVTVNMTGSLISGFTVPTVAGVPATYGLSHSQHGLVRRPIVHLAPPASPPDASPNFLDAITMPIAGYSYSFGYYDGFGPIAYAHGALTSQKVPTGATVAYEYGTWTSYHANPLNRPFTCNYPPSAPPGGILKTGPDGVEPFLPTVDQCGSPDRMAGVVKRTVGYSTQAGSETAVTKYYQWDYPHGESGSDTAAQTQTLVVSPPDVSGSVHSAAYLFTASAQNWTGGPLVGSLVRKAVYSGDQSGGATGPPSTLSAVRVWRYVYETDDYNRSPTNTASESFDANRRLLQSVVIFSGIAPASAPSGKYHSVDYEFDTNAGQHKKQKHGGTIGGDAREIETVWAPLIDADHWKLDIPQAQYLRATPGGATFSSVASTFDAKGCPISSTVTDANGYGSLVHGAPRDAHGFATSETLTHGPSSYSRTLTFASGSLKTSQWSGVPWLSTNDQIDGSTGLVSSSTNPAGLSASFTYDLLGRPRRSTPPGGDAQTETTYDSPIQATTRTPPAGTVEYAWTRTVTDSLGRPLKVLRHMPGGAVAKKVFRYDRQGHKVFESEWVDDAILDASAPGTTWSGFDQFGRPGIVTRADGGKTSIGYGDGPSYPASAWLRTVTIDNVGGAPSTTIYTYDAFGNLLRVKEPSGDETTYAYNPQNRLVQVTQGQQARSYTYDAFGFLRKEKVPERSNLEVSFLSYDALGNLLSESYPGNTAEFRRFAYDTAGRLTSASAGGRLYLANSYDGQVSCVSGPDGCPNGGTYRLGRLTRQIGYNPTATPAAAVIQDFFYSDRAGRLSSKETRAKDGAAFLTTAPISESWIYDPAGLVTRYGHPRAAGQFLVSTGYDHGFPVLVLGNGIPVARATYQPSGLITTYTAGNDTGNNRITTIARDPNGMARPSRISDDRLLLDTGTFSYDSAGNITGMGADAFGYDSLSRLKFATFADLNAPNNRQDFDYDRYGNLKSVAGVNARSLSIDTATNRLSNATYDLFGLGNLVAIGPERYTYDDLSRMTGSGGTGSDWKYFYDGRGERILKVPPAGSSPNYLWTLRDESSRVATEFVGATPSRDNVYLGGLLVGSYTSCPAPGWTYYTSDHLGSPRVAMDAWGGLLDLRKYWPFGDEARVVDPNQPQRLRFAGMERDLEGSRYYNHARSHDFNQGRFLSVDLANGAPSNPQTWNRYAYSLGNPVRYLDPNGLWPTKYTTWLERSAIEIFRGYRINGGTVHQNAIDRALSFLTPQELGILKDQQVVADAPERQAPELSFLHAMSGPGQSAAEARGAANDFVRQLIVQAKDLEAGGDHDLALGVLGNAIHTLQDSTSPMHVGFQPWRGKHIPGGWGVDQLGYISLPGLEHSLGEDFDPGAGSDLDLITAQAWRWFVDDGPLPDDFFSEVPVHRPVRPTFAPTFAVPGQLDYVTPGLPN